MSMSESFEQRAIGFLRRWIGGGILLVGSALVLPGIFWFPFKSECTFSAYSDAVLYCTRSWTEWQYALDWDGGIVFFTPFILVVLVTICALLLGVSEVFGIGEPLKRVGRRFSGRFFFLLILAFLAQCFAVLLVAGVVGNPCSRDFYFGCRDVYLYTSLRDESGVGIALIGLAFLLAYKFLALVYRFIMFIVRYVLELPNRELEQGA